MLHAVILSGIMVPRSSVVQHLRGQWVQNSTDAGCHNQCNPGYQALLGPGHRAVVVVDRTFNFQSISSKTVVLYCTYQNSSRRSSIVHAVALSIFITHCLYLAVKQSLKRDQNASKIVFTKPYLYPLEVSRFGW